MKREKTERESKRDGNDRIEEKFAEADFEVTEAQAEIEADAGEAAQTQNGVETRIQQDEFTDGIGSRWPCALQPAKIDSEAEWQQHESVQPVTVLCRVIMSGEEFDSGHAGRNKQVEQQPAGVEIACAGGDEQPWNTEYRRQGDARDERQASEDIRNTFACKTKDEEGDESQDKC